MNAYLALPLLLLLTALRPARNETSSFSREQMLNVRGFFSVLIVLFHYAGMQFFNPYLPENAAFTAFWTFVDQCVVAMFLFYSGYGLTASFSERGPSYIKPLLTRRVPRLYITYAVAAVMMVFLCWIMAITWFSIGGLVDVMVAWTGYFGDDQWYIFVQLALYGLMALCMLPLRRPGNSQHLMTICCVLLTLAVVLFGSLLYLAGKAYYWYDTLPAFVLGVWWAVGRDRITRWLKKPMIYWPCLILAIAGTAMLPMKTMWLLRVPFFCLALQLAAEKIALRSPVLRFFGEHSLSIYLVMRMPMHLMRQTGEAYAHPYLSLLPVLLLTLAFAAAYDRFCELLWNRISCPDARRKNA